MRWLVITFFLLLSGCGSDDGEVKLTRFNDDITLITSISGSGGALGEEEYRVSYRYGGEERTFSEGVNPRGFQILKTAEDAITIKFCDGTVHLAQPIFLGPPRSELIHLELDLNCQLA